MSIVYVLWFHVLRSVFCVFYLVRAFRKLDDGYRISHVMSSGVCHRNEISSAMHDSSELVAS